MAACRRCQLVATVWDLGLPTPAWENLGVGSGEWRELYQNVMLQSPPYKGAIYTKGTNLYSQGTIMSSELQSPLRGWQTYLGPVQWWEISSRPSHVLIQDLSLLMFVQVEYQAPRALLCRVSTLLSRVAKSHHGPPDKDSTCPAPWPNIMTKQITWMVVTVHQ